MNITYDVETDTLTIELRSGPVANTEEQRPGVLLDYDASDRLVAIEVLDASQRVDDVGAVRLEVVPRASGTQTAAAE